MLTVIVVTTSEQERRHARLPRRLRRDVRPVLRCGGCARGGGRAGVGGAGAVGGKREPPTSGGRLYHLLR